MDKFFDKRKIVVLVVVAISALAGMFFLQRNDEQTIVLYGNVDTRQIALAFNGSERIEEILVEEGDAVKQGQLLARLNPRPLELNIAKCSAQVDAQYALLTKLQNGSRPEEIAQAQALAEAARADYDNAVLAYERIRKLYKDGAVSNQDLDNANARYKAAAATLENSKQAYQLSVLGPRDEEIAQAEAQLKALEAQLELLQYNLSETMLLAPADGVIRSRLQEVGDMTSPQKPVFLLSLSGKKWIRAYVTEVQLGKILPGMEANVYMDSMPNKPLVGTVGYISDTAEFTPKTVQTEELRTSLVYEIRINVSDSDNVLRMGMPVTVRF